MMLEKFDAGTETRCRNGTVSELNDAGMEMIPTFTDYVLTIVTAMACRINVRKFTDVMDELEIRWNKPERWNSYVRQT